MILGYQDSNLGMTRPKPVALPLGYSPIKWRGRDSNSRTLRERIYSPPRLATSLPLRLKWCRPEDLNPQPTDYKSVALPVELGRHKWWRMQDLNLRPPACKAGALPAELILRLYDPYGIRTRVTAVKGRCLNHLTNGPCST